MKRWQRQEGAVVKELDLSMRSMAASMTIDFSTQLGLTKPPTRLSRPARKRLRKGIATKREMRLAARWLAYEECRAIRNDAVLEGVAVAMEKR